MDDGGASGIADLRGGVAPAGLTASSEAGTAGSVAAPASPAGDPTAADTPRGPIGSLAPPPGASSSECLAVDGRTRRAGKYGLSIQFAEHAGDQELARLVDATVWVNAAHPAYRRAAASRSEGYHVALAVALALAPLAVEPSREHAFITAFLASWGEALERRARHRLARGPRGRR
jgi:hypothetical protein